jgi:hypothetical protein
MYKIEVPMYMYLSACRGCSISNEMRGHCEWDMHLDTGSLQIYLS